VIDDTIFALSSGRPPAAIAVVRISGPSAFEAAQALAGSLPEPRTASVRRLRDPSTAELLDEALVLRFVPPASSTGEELVEFHCHGGRAVVDAVLACLGRHPRVRLAQPGEFTRRAFENGRIDLTEAEGLADLLEAETETQRKAALALAEGGLSKQVDAWRQELLELSAEAELAIDYVDEDSSGSDEGLAGRCAALANTLKQWLARPRVEPLKDGVRVVVAGPVNAGKSSLINAIAGIEKTIVTDIPGTTRDQIEVPLAIAGVPVVLTDTAGLRTSDDPVERIGIERARHSAGTADILLWLGLPEDAPEHRRTLLVHSKADLPERAAAPAGSLPVSARTGAGIAELLQAIGREADALMPGEGAVALNRRQARHLGEAEESLRAAAQEADLVLIAEGLRQARAALDRLTGRAGVEDVLDALFGRFCLGK
jgi:tRNA modification GTPase